MGLAFALIEFIPVFLVIISVSSVIVLPGVIAFCIQNCSNLISSIITRSDRTSIVSTLLLDCQKNSALPSIDKRVLGTSFARYVHRFWVSANYSNILGHENGRVWGESGNNARLFTWYSRKGKNNRVSPAFNYSRVSCLLIILFFIKMAWTRIWHFLYSLTTVSIASEGVRISTGKFLRRNNDYKKSKLIQRMSRCIQPMQIEVGPCRCGNNCLSSRWDSIRTATLLGLSGHNPPVPFNLLKKPSGLKSFFMNNVFY